MSSSSTSSFLADVWTYRGCHLKPGKFNIALVHYIHRHQKLVITITNQAEGVSQ